MALSRDTSELPETLTVFAAKSFVIGEDCKLGKRSVAKKGQKLELPYIVAMRLLGNKRAVASEDKVPADKKKKSTPDTSAKK